MWGGFWPQTQGGLIQGPAVAGLSEGVGPRVSRTVVCWTVEASRKPPRSAKGLRLRQT